MDLDLSRDLPAFGKPKERFRHHSWLAE